LIAQRTSSAGSLGTFLDNDGDEVFYLLDGKTAQDFAGLQSNNSSEDFVLYNHETMGTVNGTLDTRGEVKADGRRVGLREINRDLPTALHASIKAAKFLMCIMHCFSRITECILRLFVTLIVEGVSLNNYNGAEKEEKLSKILTIRRKIEAKLTVWLLFSYAGNLENILNGVISGKEIAFEFSKDGKPLPISLNGQKSKKILAAAFNGQLPLHHILPASPLDVNPLLKELFAGFSQDYRESILSLQF